ncbi:MAG: S8 family serine peptidase [Eubacterium sp.]|nr:S8 family serine peptidase [Eubacterium sp.]
MKMVFKKLTAVTLSVILAVTVWVSPFGMSAFASSSKRYVEGEAVAVLKDGVKSSDLTGGSVKLKKSFSFDSKGEELNIAVLKSNTLSTKRLINKLKDSDNVKSVIPNYKKHITSVTDDSYSSFQWALDNTGMSGGTVNADTNPEGLWDSAAQAEKEKVIAVVDTGIDYNNPEFAGKLWENPYGKKLVGKYGYDFSGDNEDATPLDNNGHGTHCAGIIAANADNQAGISGINKTNVKIMAIKWLDSEGSGTTEGVLAAYDYIERAMQLGTNVVAINNSWGGLGDLDEQSIYDEIFDKFGEMGAISVIAAGNDGEAINAEEEDDIYNVPAASSSKYALTVAATNNKDELASFSSYSEKYVDIAAPGSTILSTVSYDCFNPSIYTDAKRTETVNVIQDYNGEFTSASFGYPIVDTTTGKNSYASYPLSDKLVVSRSDDSFGSGGNAVCVKTNEAPNTNKNYSYLFTVPFTVADKDADYSVSFMFKGLGYSDIIVYDVPADFDYEELENIEYSANCIGEDGMNGWDHIFFTSSPSNDETYEKANDRKLVFLIDSVANGENTSVILDDLAISKQGIDASLFERYDFHSGTSMATPYVSGAVALLENAYPKARINDIINMIKNTGRYSAALEGKTQNSRILSLENAEKCPPLISSVAYNKDGKVSVKGSFMSVGSVNVNSAEVTPESNDGETIVLKDDNYNTKKATVSVTNEYGQDTYTTLLSKKTLYPEVKNVIGSPSGSSSSVMLQNESVAYFVSDGGSVGTLEYDKDDEVYTYEEADNDIDFTKLFKNYSKNNTKEITSAVYSDGFIYFTALTKTVTSTGVAIGCDCAFGSFDLNNETTALLCDLPDDADAFASLGAYKGNILLIGGITDSGLSNKVYKYNKSKKAFEASGTLPEGRAGAKFLQFENTLVGVYGINEAGTLPDVRMFNGSAWTKAPLGYESEDYNTVDYNKTKYNMYFGNLGTENNGVFCNGSYLYGVGDTFVFNMKTKKVVDSKYSSRNDLTQERLVGTTLPGCFIGFEESVSFDIFGSFGIFADDTTNTLEKLITTLLSSPGTPHSIPVSNEKFFPPEKEDNEEEEDDWGDWNIDWGDEEEQAPTPTASQLKKAKLNKKLNLKESKISTNAKVSKKAIKAKWKKVKGASNYQIRYRKAGAKKWKYKYTNNKTNYLIKKLKVGELYDVQIRALKKTSKGWQRSEWCKVNRRYIKTVKITKLQLYKTMVRVSWKNDKKANASQIIVYSDKACTKKVKSLKVKGSKTSRARIKGLKKNTKYYVKVRPIKKKGKNEYLGQLSSSKAFNTKK